MILGVAVGYLEAEFEALGVPYDERARQARLVAVGDEGGVGRRAGGQHRDAPLCAATASADLGRREIPRPRSGTTIEHGDGWSPFPASPRTAAAVDTTSMTDTAMLTNTITRFHEHAEEAGRRAPLDVCFTPFSHPGHKDVVDPKAFVAEAYELEAIGVTWLAFHLPAPSVVEFCDTVAEFGEAVAEVRS